MPARSLALGAVSCPLQLPRSWSGPLRSGRNLHRFIPIAAEFLGAVERLIGALQPGFRRFAMIDGRQADGDGDRKRLPIDVDAHVGDGAQYALGHAPAVRECSI